jgi:hypothetical protein
MEEIFVAGGKGKKTHKCKVHLQLKKEAMDFLERMAKKNYCQEEMAVIIFLINRLYNKAEMITI